MTATTEAVQAPTTPRSQLLATLIQRQGAAAVLLIAVLISWLALPSFGTSGNLRAIALQSSFLAIIAIGMTFVIVTGGIDLSVGSVYALGGVLAALGAQHGFLAAIVLPLAVCLAIGVINGVLVARFGLPPFIVTLATLLFARGLLLALTKEGATTRTITNDTVLALGRGSFLGLGMPVWFAILLALGAGVLLQRTRFGESVFAAGGAESSALLMGLPVQRVKIAVYALSGLLSGFAGLLTAAYLQSGVTVIGVGTELDAIAAVVIGGTLLSGGAGTILGTMVGVLLRNVIANVINQIGGLDSNYQSVISGVFLLVVVCLQRLLTGSSILRRRKGRRPSAGGTAPTATRPAASGATAVDRAELAPKDS